MDGTVGISIVILLLSIGTYTLVVRSIPSVDTEYVISWGLPFLYLGSSTLMGSCLSPSSTLPTIDRDGPTPMLLGPSGSCWSLLLLMLVAPAGHYSS